VITVGGVQTAVVMGAVVVRTQVCKGLQAVLRSTSSMVQHGMDADRFGAK